MPPHLAAKSHRPWAALLGATLLALSAFRVHAEGIRCYYSVNQKVFLVTAFEGGLPKLDREVEPSEAPDPQHVANVHWQIDGALTLDPAFAAPIVDYSIARIAPSYKERLDPPRCEVRLHLSKASAYGWTPGDGEEFLIVAWVADGQVKEAFVTSPKATDLYASAGKFTVSLTRKDGYPLCWYVRNGSLVARATQAAWDPLFFGPPPRLGF